MANSRLSGTDHRGLGSEPSRQAALAQGTCFIQALSASQPQDMDCSPAIQATVLPPLQQPDSMDTDDPEPQAVIPDAQSMQISARTQPTEDVRMSLCTGWTPTQRSAFPREMTPSPGYMLRSRRTSLSYRSHSTSMLLSRLLMRQRRSVSVFSSALRHPRHAEAALLPLSHPDFRLQSSHAARSQQP